MKQRTGNEIRQLFLDYFKQNGHMVEPGASLIPHNDPTLLWINAGVAALKKYFDGSEQPRCNRITNAQKSIRTNDIENVGKTARHHTFFEMLGNFSIGDYFKEEAIVFAWDFLTNEKWIGFPKEKLYISIYSDDEVAYKTWTEVCHVDPSHILRTDGNYWEIGEGPGGPDSEIFFDRGEAFDPKGLGEKLFFKELENDRYIEVWNVVFSQYDCKPELDRKEYKELPQKNIDTGMGLERLVSLVQGGETNFDTDLFLPIIRETEKISKYPYDGEYKMSYRVIADHIRTVTFALSDGALFSNNGRGYVLRRVLRRAVRYGIKLGINKPFMYELVNVVANNMKEFYPYLMDKIEYNANLIKIEEETFHKTLKNGEQLLHDEIQKANNQTLGGEVIFKLYDTYGFPFELTAEIAEENNVSVDENGFKEEMQKQKDRARAARENVESMGTQSEALMNFVSESEFVGYDAFQCKATIIALFQDGEKVDVLEGEGSVIFDKTCFYAESGGQIGDIGTIANAQTKALVKDVRKAPHGQPLHLVNIENGCLKIGDQCELLIDLQRRNRITVNHSATHLLQSALRKVVGDHTAQAGSYVTDEYLRFDFTHFEKVNEQQLDEIEQIVNTHIQNQLKVNKQVMSLEDAKKTGATALFDEKYGDFVRVVSMGDVSIEFCGGCHVNNTSEIGLLKIDFEESIGSGIRRISAKTGLSAYVDFKEKENTLKTIAKHCKMKSLQGIEEKMISIIDELSVVKKELEKCENEILLSQVDSMISQVQEVNGIKVFVKSFDNMDGATLKNMAISLRDKLDSCVVFLASKAPGKVVFVATCSKSAIKSGVHCGNLVKEAATICGGNGGGKPDLAQAGGKSEEKVDEAIVKIGSNLGLSLSN